MKIKLDENMPEAAASFLTSCGCDVETVFSEKLSGASDPVVMAAAKKEGRVLVTLDKGIANVLNPDYDGHAGVVLLRLKHPGVDAIVSLLKAHFPALADESLDGRIVVISASGVRVR